MNFFRAGFAHHAHNLFRSRAAYNRIIDQNYALAFDQMAHGIQLDADAEAADRLLRFNERAADIVVAHQTEPERQATFRRVTNRRRHARVRNRHDEVDIGGVLDREALTHLVPRAIHGLTKDERVGPREVHMLKNAHRVTLRIQWMR